MTDLTLPNDAAGLDADSTAGGQGVQRDEIPMSL